MGHMMRVSGASRSFLFLQGPHGPFFHRLGTMLRAAGSTVHRAGFNRGDQAFWPDRDSYIPVRGNPDDWPATLDAIIDRHAVTDIVLYGDTPPVHATAVPTARARGLTGHGFEEGHPPPHPVRLL